MVVITVCVGSSCYLRGAHKVADSLQQEIIKHALNARVELQGSFCMNRCREGVAVSVNGVVLPRATPENARELFATYVLPEVNRDAGHTR